MGSKSRFFDFEPETRLTKLFCSSRRANPSASWKSSAAAALARKWRPKWLGRSRRRTSVPASPSGLRCSTKANWRPWYAERLLRRHRAGEPSPWTGLTAVPPQRRYGISTFTRKNCVDSFPQDLRQARDAGIPERRRELPPCGRLVRSPYGVALRLRTALPELGRRQISRADFCQP